MRLKYPSLNIKKIEAHDKKETNLLKIYILEITWYSLIPLMLAHIAYRLDQPLILILILPMLLLRVKDE